jgi:predicted DNA-binding mobile mystery protein A
MKKHKLIIAQMDQKLLKFHQLQEVIIPPEGWIYSIRTAIKMSLRQLGKRLHITAQSVKEIETREKNGTISINVLKQVGQALNMKFVYGFIPKTETLEKMINERAIELAKEIVLRTSANMRLEDQENLPERINNSIKEKASDITREIPRYLWD